MPVNSANTQLQCPEFTGFFLCAPPAVAPLYELKVNTRVFFHKISNNNVSVRSETQCLWDLTMLGGRNLFRKKKKKHQPSSGGDSSLPLSLFFLWTSTAEVLFSAAVHSSYSKALEEVPLTTRQFVLTLDADAGWIFFWSVWVRSIDLGRVSSQKPLLAALSSGDVMRRERGVGVGGRESRASRPPGLTVCEHAPVRLVLFLTTHTENCAINARCDL